MNWFLIQWNILNLIFIQWLAHAIYKISYTYSTVGIVYISDGCIKESIYHDQLRLKSCMANERGTYYDDHRRNLNPMQQCLCVLPSYLHYRCHPSNLPRHDGGSCYWHNLLGYTNLHIAWINYDFHYRTNAHVKICISSSRLVFSIKRSMIFDLIVNRIQRKRKTFFTLINI